MIAVARCQALAKQHNPLALWWDEQPFAIRSLLRSEINDGRGLSILIKIGEPIDNGFFEVPIFTYKNIPRCEGMTVGAALASLGEGIKADMGVQIPETLIDDCVRLCCSLCLLEGCDLFGARVHAAILCGVSGFGA